jgi:hypothetical protein
MMSLHVAALLGRCDFPTDGVEDYCARLSQALAKRGVALQLVRMPWAERGWFYALRWLWQEARAWQGRWVLVQYTALAWSRRGFPIGLLPVLKILRGRKCRLGIVYHLHLPFLGVSYPSRIVFMAGYAY